MFTQKLCVAFLTLAISSFAAQAAPASQFRNPGNQAASCDTGSGQVSTVFHTVTVTANAPPAQTSAAGSTNNGSSGSAGGSNNANTNTGKGNTNNTNTNTNTGKGNTNNTNTNTGKGNTNTNTGGGKNTGNGGGNSNTGGNNTNTGSSAGAGNSTNTGSTANAGDAQSSLTLDPGVIAKGFANNGQDVPAAGQVASLTSTNNFINFCLTVPNLPITNGQQIQGGSCNPAPIGTIPSTDNMPSSKFSFPTNFGAVKTGTAFTIKMQIQNMQTGFFVNANENYFAAPQQLNAQGQIQGHSHVVIEALSAIDQTTLTDPKKFVFFKGLNAAAANGQLTADVTNGLPVGAYKLSSINSAANHQPVIAPVAQHGSLDDAVYFFVTADGNPPANAPFSNNGAAASSAAATSSTVVAASASASASASLTNSVAASASATASVKGSAAASATGKGAAATAKGGAATVKGGAASSAVASASATGKGAGAAAPPKATATGKDTPAGAGSTKATATEKSAAAASTASPAAGTKGTTAGEAGTSKSDPSASNSGKN